MFYDVRSLRVPGTILIVAPVCISKCCPEDPTGLVRQTALVIDKDLQLDLVLHPVGLSEALEEVLLVLVLLERGPGCIERLQMLRLVNAFS